jgi:DNA-binding SARP family transcriptional activator
MALNHHSSWRFYLLGGLRVERDGREIDLPPYRCQPLLVFLLLNHTRSVRRERLAGNLFPDLSHKLAHKHLSDHLWLIRSALPELQIESTGHTVQINSSPIWLDCEAFSEGIRQNETEAMFAAVQLYKGDLVPDLYADWAVLAREQYRNKYVNTLLVLASRYEKMGQYLRSIEMMNRHLLEEPFDEAAVRQLMRTYVRIGRRGLAISTFEKYRLLWIEQLNIQPEDETQVLYESILARTNSPKTSADNFDPPADNPWILIQQAVTALNEGDRFRMLNFLRAASKVQDPDLALQCDLLYVDEAILWEDASCALQRLEDIDRDSGDVELRRAELSLTKNDMKGAYQILQRVLNIATNTDDRELEAMALNKISAVKMMQTEFQAASLAINRSIYLLSQMDRPVLLVKSYLQKGEILYRQGINHDARDVLFQAQSLAEAHNYNCLLAEINYFIGNSFSRSGRYLNAYKILTHALETARDVGLKKLEAKILLGLAAVCDFLGRKEECIQLLNSTREIFLKLNDPIGLAKVDYNLAAALPYHDESRCNEAVQHAKSALKVFEEHDQREMQAVTHTALAFALWVDGHFQEAVPHYRQSIDLHRALGEYNYIPELYAYVGLAFLGSGNLEDALEWTGSACYELSMHNHSDIVTDIYYARGLALEVSGKMDEAEKLYMRAYQTLLDFAQEIEEEEARQAYFHRDPVTRRLMKKVNKLGLSPPSRQMVVKRSISGRSKDQVEYHLTVNTGAPDQALAQGKGDAALRRVRLQRLLSQAERQHTHLTLNEIAQALNVSMRTVQRDMRVLKSKKMD